MRTVASSLAALAALAVVSGHVPDTDTPLMRTHAAHTNCGHSDPQISQWMEDQDAHVVPQRYEEHAHGRSLSTFVSVRNSTDTTPIRIKPLWTVVDGGGREFDSVKGSVRTRSCSNVGQVIDVAPASGSTFEDYTCTSADNVAVGSERYNVMQTRTQWAADFWGDALTVKRTTSPITIASGISTTYNIPLADRTHADVDLVVIMVARPSPNSPVAGFAGCLQRDQYYRCTVGFFNWVPGIFDVENALRPEAISSERHTAAHEMAHILGAVLLGPHFINEDTGIPVDPATIAVVEDQSTDFPKAVTKIKSPRVLAHAREAYGCPTLSGVPLEDVPLGKGAHWESRVLGPEFMSYGSFAGEVYISDLTLAFLEDTNQYIANYTLAGRLVEAAEVASDSDIFDFLVSSDAEVYVPPTPLSPGYLRWGRGEGCDFVNRAPSHWPTRYVCTEHQDYGCTPDFRASAVCMLSVGIQEVTAFTCGDVSISSRPSEPFDRWTTTCPAGTNDNCPGGVCGLPSMYQHFGPNADDLATADGDARFPTRSGQVVTAGTMGGVSSSVDYVPVRVAYANCADSGTLTSADNRTAEEGAAVDASVFGQESDFDDFGGQERCPDCRCFTSSLIEVTKGVNPIFPTYGLCYRSNCYRPDYLQVGIRGVTQDKTFWYKCPAEGGKLYIAGFTGALTCPPATEFCAQNTVSGLKFAETDRLLEFIVWFVMVALLVGLLIVCMVPCIREPLIFFMKAKCGVMHFDHDYADNKNIREVLEEKAVWAPDPMLGKWLSRLNYFILFLGIAVLLAAGLMYAQNAISSDSAAPLMAVAIFTLVLAGIGVAASTADAKGVSCSILSYFFLTSFTLLGMLFVALQTFASDNTTRDYVEDRWDRVCDFYHDADFCRQTEVDPALRTTAIDDVTQQVQDRIYAVMVAGVFLMMLLLTGAAIAGRIIHADVILASAFTVLNWSTIGTGLCLFGASVYFLVEFGRGTAANAAFATCVTGSIWLIALGAVGVNAAFTKSFLKLRVHLGMSFLAAVICLAAGILFFTSVDEAQAKVDGYTDDELGEIAGQFDQSLSRDDFKNAVADALTKLAYASFLFALASCGAMVLNVQFSARLQQFFDELELEAAARKKKSAMRRKSTVAVPIRKNPMGHGAAKAHAAPTVAVPVQKPAAPSKQVARPRATPGRHSKAGAAAGVPAPAPAPARAGRPRVRRKGPHAQI